MLNFSEFQHYVEAHIREYLPYRLRDAEITPETTLKNNGVKLQGLVIKPADSNVGVNMYLENFYQDYVHGHDLDDIIDRIAVAAAAHTGHKSMESFGIADFMNYDSVKDKIIMSVINAEKNTELLQDTVHTKWEDLAIVYKVMVRDSDVSFGTILIKESHLDSWGIDKERLHEQAVESSKALLPASAKDMATVLNGILYGMDPDTRDAMEEVGLPSCTDKLLHVITNEKGIHGASAIFYDDTVFEHLSEVYGGDFMLLPSSVHEWVVAPFAEGKELDYFANMVKEINDTMVEKDEVLSDHVYVYNAKERVLKMMDTKEPELAETEGYDMALQMCAEPGAVSPRPRHHR